MMGGTIGVESEPNEGSCFWFEIPLDTPTAKQIRGLEDLKTLEDGARDSKFDKHVLVVEDVLTNQFVIMDILETMGCRVDLATNGEESLKAVKQTDYDIVLMDCQMPVMDGFEATRHIRDMSITQPLIVALTANALEGDREKCLDAGMDDFLAKPISKQDVINIMDKFFEQNPKK